MEGWRVYMLISQRVAETKLTQRGTGGGLHKDIIEHMFVFRKCIFSSSDASSDKKSQMLENVEKGYKPVVFASFENAQAEIGFAGPIPNPSPSRI